MEERAVVVFDSMWHSTEMMATAVAEGFKEAGIPVILHDIKATPMSDIVTDLFTSKYLAVGSPTINNNMMPTIAAFLCYLKGLAPKNHLAFAFGSYGWGGQSIGLVEDALKDIGCEICLEKIRLRDVPTPEQLEEITAKVKGVKG